MVRRELPVAQTAGGQWRQRETRGSPFSAILGLADHPTPLPYVPIAIAVTQFHLIWVHQYQRKDLKTTQQLPGLVSNPQKREIFHNQDSHENSILLRLKDLFW